METPSQDLNHRTCTCCGASKPEDDFYLQRNWKTKQSSYRMAQCKECIKAKNRARYETPPRFCRKCGLWKRERDFYLRSAKPGRKRSLATECKKCTHERSQRSYLANYETVRAKENRKRREGAARIRDAVFSHYGGDRCACCGETEKLFLTLDHINNDGADLHERRHLSASGKV